MSADSRGAAAFRRPFGQGRRQARRWIVTAAMTAITVILLIPVLGVILDAFRPNSEVSGFSLHGDLTLSNFRTVFTQTGMPHYLLNSVLVSLGTAIVAVAVASPAGYALSRARGKAMSGYSFALFVIQSLPTVVLVIPLFILFSSLGLVDSLVGVTIIYVGSVVAIACWMMAGYFDSIPASIEEAAWLDGCSVLSGFLRIILRNSLPGILSAGMFSFLIAWNDYLVALVFLHSSSNWTLPVGMEQFFQQNQTQWGDVMASALLTMAPPVLIFAVFARYFSFGGISGSLSGE